MEAIVTLTFKSISGNRYRCNQTDVVVKNTKKYAYSFYKKEQNKKKQQEKAEMANTRPIRHYWPERNFPWDRW